MNSKSIPNVLIICSDQHNREVVGYRRHPAVQTPNLDRLAAEGTVFTRAYCTNPICTPSRMSFITGRYTHRIGVPTNGFPLDPEIMTWARQLDSAGIETTMLGKMDFVGEYQDGGFTHHRIIRRRQPPKYLTAEPPYRWTAPLPSRLLDGTRTWGAVADHLRHAGARTAKVNPDWARFGERDHFVGNYDHDMVVTEWAVEYLKQKGSEREGRPWLCYVGLVYPHDPFIVPAEYFDRYMAMNIELPPERYFPNTSLHPAMQHVQRAFGVGRPDRHDLKRTLAAYLGMVDCMDRMIGRMLDELETTGLARNTVVIYLSDHGETLGQNGLFYKINPFDGSTGVPLIIRGPGVPVGKTVDTAVDLSDLYPTLTDLYGLSPADGVDGSSLLPLCRGEGSNHRGFAFIECHGYMNRYDWFSIVKGPYKYIWYSNGEQPSVFNIDDDPAEERDLAEDSEHVPVLEEHERLLRTICDPEQVCLEAKQSEGLIGPDGEDFTQTLTVGEARKRFRY
jgi:choline-sulfatase